MSATAGARTRRTPVSSRRHTSTDARGKRIRPRASVGLSDDEVERALELWLRGSAFAAIGRELGIHRDTARALVRQAYAEALPRRQGELAGEIQEAIARLMLVLQQAWADHDADVERELALLEEMQAGKLRGWVRYHSQRAAYLRVALGAIREIARLKGLYAVGAADEDQGAVVFRIEMIGAGEGAVAEASAESGSDEQLEDGDG